MDASLRDFLAAAIATLKGSAGEKKLAYAETDSEKEAAAANGLAVATAKTYMQRLYRKNGVHCMARLLLVGFHNLSVKQVRRPKPTPPSPPELPALPKNVRREPRDEGRIMER